MAPESRRPSLFGSTVAGDVDLADFDRIREVSPEWDQLHVQLGRGRPRVRATLAQASRFQLAVLARSPGARVEGQAPRGTTVLALALRGPRLQLQGRPWEQDRVGVQSDGRAFEIISPAPHAVLVLAVDRHRLDEAATERFGAPLPAGLSGPCLRLRDRAATRRIIATCARGLRAARRDPGLVADAGRAALLEAEVLDAFLDGVDPEPVSSPIGPRRELARRAEAFLRDSLREPVRLQDVCDAVGASSRSVHAAFQHVYGIPPKAYLKALRLSAARSELSRGRPETTVSDVAARLGFLQFGSFSVEYRRMFGEQPRQTLRRARSGNPEPDPVRPAAAVRVPVASMGLAKALASG